MTLKEQVAFLKGLAKGLDFNTESKEGKIISSIVDTLIIMADEIDDLVENALDIGDELDALSEDLADVEEIVFDGADDDDTFFDFDYDDDDDDDDGFDNACDSECYCNLCNSGNNVTADNSIDDTADNVNEETEVTYDITCPACNAEIELDESDLAKTGIDCPRCNEYLEFEFDDDGN